MSWPTIVTPRDRAPAPFTLSKRYLVRHRERLVVLQRRLEAGARATEIGEAPRPPSLGTA